MVTQSSNIKPSEQRISSAAARVCQEINSNLTSAEVKEIVNKIYQIPLCTKILCCRDFAEMWHRLRIDYNDKLDLPIYPSESIVTENLCDRNLPTLGCIIDRAYDALPQFAIAAQKRKQSGQQSINLVFITKDELASHAHYLKYENGCAMAVDRGVLVDIEGNWKVAEFKPPLVIDVISTFASCADNFEKKIEAQKIKLLNDIPCLTLTNDKEKSRQFLTNAGLKAPRQLIIKRYPVEEAPAIKVRELLSEFYNEIQGSSVVIKPTSLSGGRGVEILDNPKFKHLKHRAYACFLKYQNCAVEERIESFPLIAKLTEGGPLQRLDWNIRVIANKYGVIDMEARVGEWGSPINVCQGAKVWEVKHLLSKLGASAPTYAELLAGINSDISMAAKLLNGGIQGYDLIINPQKERYYIEVNAGMVGGFGSLFKIRNWRDQFNAAEKAIEHFFLQLSEEINSRGKYLGNGTRLGLVSEVSSEDSNFQKRIAVLSILHEPEVQKIIKEFGFESPLEFVYSVENDWFKYTPEAQGDHKAALYYSIVESYDSLGSYRDVLRMAGFMDLVSNQHDLHCITGMAYYRLGMLEEALEEFSRINQSCRKLTISTMFTAINLATEYKKYELAFKLCDMLAELFPHIAHICSNTKASIESELKNN